MAIINNVNGYEREAINFIMKCMDKIKAEADIKELIKVNLDYLRLFIESFDENEISPIYIRANKIYNAQIANRPIDIASTKMKNEMDAANGIRTATIVESELPKWPSCFKNPHHFTRILGTTPIGKNKKKGMSALTNSKLSNKIKSINSELDVLYLIEYFLKFFFIEKEKEHYQEYDQFLTALNKIGYYPKERKSCFLKKTQEGISNDIICLFLAEDFIIKDNREFLLNCLDRYYELFS